MRAFTVRQSFRDCRNGGVGVDHELTWGVCVTVARFAAIRHLPGTPMPR